MECSHGLFLWFTGQQRRRKIGYRLGSLENTHNPTHYCLHLSLSLSLSLSLAILFLSFAKPWIAHPPFFALICLHSSALLNGISEAFRCALCIWELCCLIKLLIIANLSHYSWTKLIKTLHGVSGGTVKTTEWFAGFIFYRGLGGAEILKLFAYVSFFLMAKGSD